MCPDDLHARVAAQLPEITALRRDLHRHPELMYREQRTMGVICRELDALDLPYRAGMAGGTGIVAHLPRGSGSLEEEASAEAVEVVALRADMDALPISEATAAPWASESPGVMHACGHDGHTAILLGAARVLAQLPERPRPVTLLFQPAEEGGGGGAKMVEEGALSGEGGGGIGPPVSRVYALHGWPSIPVGRVTTRPGPLMGAAQLFEIDLVGEGGHAAIPHRARDPLLAAAQLVSALQSIVARNVDPLDAAVVTVGSLQAGNAHNVIPDEARLRGTIRALDDEVQALLRARIESVATTIARGLGCEAKLRWQPDIPVTRNDPALAERVLDLARDTLGPTAVRALERPTMTAEDFAFYARQVPACMFFLGLDPPGGDSPRLHQPDFDFNDEALGPGIAMMVRLALEG